MNTNICRVSKRFYMLSVANYSIEVILYITHIEVSKPKYLYLKKNSKRNKCDKGLLDVGSRRLRASVNGSDTFYQT